jgi:hypothetical protein
VPELNFTGHLETDVFLLQARMIYPGDETRIMRDVAMRMTRAAEDAGKVCELDVVLTSPLWDAGPNCRSSLQSPKTIGCLESRGPILDKTKAVRSPCSTRASPGRSHATTVRMRFQT